MNQIGEARVENYPQEGVPTELIALKQRLADQPRSVRSELEPLLDEALEHARFRAQVMWVAREALQRYRLDLSRIRFDLEATRRERDRLMA
jgi:hypothetical protein